MNDFYFIDDDYGIVCAARNRKWELKEAKINELSTSTHGARYHKQSESKVQRNDAQTVCGIVKTRSATVTTTTTRRTVHRKSSSKQIRKQKARKSSNTSNGG